MEEEKTRDKNGNEMKIIYNDFYEKTKKITISFPNHRMALKPEGPMECKCMLTCVEVTSFVNHHPVNIIISIDIAMSDS